MRTVHSSPGKSDDSAFTLIELLVVIAIVMIVAALLVPVFSSAKLSAKRVASQSNLSQMGSALLLYAVDYDDHVAHGIPLVWSQHRQSVPDDLLKIALGAPIVEDNLRPYGLTKELLRAPNDPGFSEFHPSPSFFEVVGTSYDIRRRSTLLSLPLTHYDHPSDEPLAWEIGEYFDSSNVPEHVKVNVLYFDRSSRYTLRQQLFRLLGRNE